VTVIDYLLAQGVHREVAHLLDTQTPAAPDVLVFELLAVLRRHVLKGQLGRERAAMAVADLGDLGVDLFPSLALRQRVFGLRENFTAGDALNVALAEVLGETLLTKDRGLARAVGQFTDVPVQLV